MKNISLNIKIIIIFLIPVFALVYFSFYFIKEKSEKLSESAKYKLTARFIGAINHLTHNIQLERGLSAGYIVSANKEKNKQELLKQYKNSDAAYSSLIELINLQSTAKKAIEKEIAHKNKRRIKSVIYQWSNIQTIRDNILNSEISFNNEILYYSKINTQLMHTIDSFLFILKEQTSDEMSLSKLQYLKEYAGLERAYIYHALLSNNRDNAEMIKDLQNSQLINRRAFKLNASIESTLIYSRVLQKTTANEVKRLRTKFLNDIPIDAQTWFKYSTTRIDMLDTIVIKILNNYIVKANNIYTNTLNSLYLTAILWFFSLISLSMLTFILRRMISNEENYKDELRISAYTFDSHEAMTITDVNGTILKVNNGFTRITGYTAEEVIGKNPRVLKSMKHDEVFYQNMWKQLHVEGKWSDEIYNMRKNGEIYPEKLSITAIKNEEGITTHYIAQFLDISDLKKAQETAEHQADHDFLTGLANRKQLTKRLHEEFIKARRHNFLHAFLFIDLDNFKKVNDNYGHKVGDLLLIKVTESLKSLVREEDLIARVSGDEFAILILNIDKEEAEAAKDIKEICTKILKNLEEPFIIDTHKLEIGASIGIKLFPDGEKTAQDVIIQADTAMYQAKHQGKNQFVFFDKSIELELRQLTLLEEEIKNGFNKNEFKLYYQPKVNVKSDTIYGAELLARWEHPSKGLLYPDSFIGMASELNMLENFTSLALHSACRFIQEHNNLIEGTLAINISAQELINPLFEKDVIDTIESYNISPRKIELEITENELIKDFDLALSKITSLQEFGVQFSIDDFGTGYSSITYLKQIPVNTLKIDRSFLQNLSNSKDRELIKVIVNMAKIFHMNIVAEGIENRFDLDFIKENDIQLYQGYYFSKAVTQESFLNMLENPIKH